MTHTGRCYECGKPVGLSSAFLAGLCSECDDKPQLGYTFAFLAVFTALFLAAFFLMAVLG